MYVCLCNAITEQEIRQAAAMGVTELQELKDGLGVATCCGTCEPCAREILQQATACKRQSRVRQAA